MYEDDNRRGYLLRGFLLRLILIIIFVLLLVWLLPIPKLTGLNDKIFNANVAEMKDAAISYFTTDRLPQNVGDSVTLTLQEMLDMKLLLPFKDKDGKSCDVKNSYVKLTKMEKEYELKVYLKCNKEEDYIIVHLGCYSYCEQAICEKEEVKEEKTTKTSKGGSSTKVTPSKPVNPTPVTPTPTTGKVSCTLEIASGTKGENGWYLGDVVVRFKSKTTTTKGAKIISYGIGTSAVYNNKTSYTVTNNGTTNVYGYVKDSKGKTAVCNVVVKKDSEKPSCTLAVLSGTKNNEGYISDVKVGFSSRTESVSGLASYGVTNSSTTTYNSKTSYLVTNYGTTKVYGYVKDKAGNKAVCDLSVKKVKVEEEKYSNPSCSLKVTSGTLGNNNWYTSNVAIGFASKKTTNGATITSYGLGTSTNYNGNTSYTISSDGTKTVYGYVKDSNGNTSVCSIQVKRDATKPNCSVAVQSGTSNGDYYTGTVTVGFKSKTDATSGINSYGLGKSTTYGNNSTYKITTDGTHTIYGYVKDNAGNTNVCSTKVVRKTVTYEYEYVKTWGDRYSEWSGWTTATYDPSNPPKFGTTTTKITEDLGSKKVEDGYTYKVGAPIYGDVLKETVSIKEKTCSGYNYYRTSTTSTKTYAVKVASNDGWSYLKTITKVTKPADTLSVKYVMAGFDTSVCGNTCTASSPKLFKVYTRDVSTVTATDTITTSSGVKVTCKSFETKTSYLFGTYNTVIGYEQLREVKYKTVYSYRYKTRTLIQKAGSSTKWSTSANDTALINDGYKMTGNKRIKG